MQLGAEAVFVGSGIFKSADPAGFGQGHRRGHHPLPRRPTSLAKVSRGLGDAMRGAEIDTLEVKLAERGW